MFKLSLWNEIYSISRQIDKKTKHSSTDSKCCRDFYKDFLCKRENPKSWKNMSEIAKKKASRSSEILRGFQRNPERVRISKRKYSELCHIIFWAFLSSSQIIIFPSNLLKIRGKAIGWKLSPGNNLLFVFSPSFFSEQVKTKMANLNKKMEKWQIIPQWISSCWLRLKDKTENGSSFSTTCFVTQSFYFSWI